MRTLLIRLVLLFVGLSSVGVGAEVTVGMTEAAMVAAKGAPDGKITAGKKAIYRYPDMTVTLADGKIASIEKRDLALEAAEAKKAADFASAAKAKKAAAEEAKNSPSAPATPSPSPAEGTVSVDAQPKTYENVKAYGPTKVAALANATSLLPEETVVVGEPVYSLRKGLTGQRDEYRCTLEYEQKP